MAKSSAATSIFWDAQLARWVPEQGTYRTERVGDRITTRITWHCRGNVAVSSSPKETP